MSDLSAPLRSRRDRRVLKAGGRRLQRLQQLAIGCALLLAVTAAGAVLTTTLDRGPAGSSAPASQEIAADASASAFEATITVEPEYPVASIVAAPQLDNATLAGSGPADPEARLLEATAFGSIPRIGPSGETAFAAYSRPATPVTTAGKPRVAIVVTGLGLDPAGTRSALDTLPADITLAYAPHGDGLPASVAVARADGHEIFLELPLEPFNYPEVDPGPETLLTGADAAANRDRLFAMLARFGGYVGVINYLGGSFTASRDDLGPLLQELAARGLGYLDDGSSRRSLAPELAGASRLPFNRADLLLDAEPARGPILAQLDALAEAARRNGSAVGIASALPVSVRTIAEWARSAAGESVAIVPASALMQD